VRPSFAAPIAARPRDEQEFVIASTSEPKSLLKTLLVLSFAFAPQARALDPASKFGAGLMVGSVASLTGKYWSDETRAFDFGLGNNYAGASWIFADALWHSLVFAPVPHALPYLGAGLGLGFKRSFSNNKSDTDAFVRLPLGMNWLPERGRFEFFGELVPSFILTPFLESGPGTTSEGANFLPFGPTMAFI
jgi:hypothetical protein